MKFKPSGPLFIGAFIDPKCAEVIWDRANQALPEKAFRSVISITPAQNLHITLAFLGYEKHLPLHKLEEWWSKWNFREFVDPVELSSIATFGKRSSTIHLKGIFEEGDIKLRGQMVGELKAIPLELEERSFKVHLTVGRFRGEAKDGRRPVRRKMEELLNEAFCDETFISRKTKVRLAAKNPGTGLYEDAF